MKGKLIDNKAGKADVHIERKSRRTYCPPDLSPVEFMLEGMVLNCSQTTYTISPNQVIVDDYKVGFDDGYGNDEGFDLTF